MAGAGDVNGDGYADVIVGARYYDAGQTNEGAAFLFLGSAAGIAERRSRHGRRPARVEPGRRASLGDSVAGAGDVNGDGYDDVIVGPPLRRGQTDEGAAFVFLGSASGHRRRRPDDGRCAARVEPAGRAPRAQRRRRRRRERRRLRRRDRGRAGLRRRRDRRGRRLRLPGQRAGITDATPRRRHARHRVEPGECAVSAASVAGAGDVNGDGYADVIVGAPQLRRGPDRRGRRLRLPRQRVGHR